MSPRFLIVNTALGTLFAAAWYAGWLDGLSSMPAAEWAMLWFLAVYFAAGLGAAARGNWSLVRHLANGLPMWALGFTVLGLVMATSGLGSLTPEALASVFRHIVLALVPNGAAILLFVWLREIAHWCGGEEV